MADCMTFPDTVEEFMEQYKITDTEHIYTNGTELVPIFRMMQWFDHKSDPRWVPCSERLPEANGRYLVTRGLNACGSLWNRVYIANYSDLMGLKRERIWWQGNVGKSDFERIDDVLAWMPLPECYREGEG